MKHFTRFRAYRLSGEGASMSLSVNDHFTLIEARYNDDNRSRIMEELLISGKESIDILHITSWDKDHCNEQELGDIIKELKPHLIEYPCFQPETENGERSLRLITNFYPSSSRTPITPNLVMGKEKVRFIGEDIFYSPYKCFDSSNDNSVVKFFRCGSFQILSLGDCEATEISEYLQEDEILRNEVDVLILPHHGSTHSVVTPEFLDAIQPKVAVCPVDYANKFEHPDDEIYGWLHDRGIKYFSTKSGDILIKTHDKYSYDVIQYPATNGQEESVYRGTAKTHYIHDEE